MLYSATHSIYTSHQCQMRKEMGTRIKLTLAAAAAAADHHDDGEILYTWLYLVHELVKG